DLERYLFDNVAPAFRTDGQLSALDVLWIANWKAPRARVYVARRLCKLGMGDIEAGAAIVAAAAGSKRDPEARFRAMMGDCGFALPMGSAILTVLDESTFSVYDRRVCDELGAFHNLINITNVDRLWTNYLQYLERVRGAAPRHLSLRDADRWLWAKSAVG